MIVLGAGIIGLYTALLLTEKGEKVVVVAQHLPGDLSIDYTSPIAGAHFSVLFGSDERMTRFCRESYAMLKLFFQKFEDQQAEAGLTRLPQIQFFDKRLDPALIKTFEYADEFTEIVDEAELKKRGAQWGMRYLTFNFYSPKLLDFLKKYLESQGVQFVRAHVDRISDLRRYPGSEVVFNCTGVTAPKLKDFNDSHRNFPVRGQVVCVRAPQIKANYALRITGCPPTYIIPRAHSGGRVILGGYMDQGDFTETSRGEQTKSIVARATKLVPELLENGPLEILDERVGLRPGRDGGPRIEKEVVDGITVIHNYGAGGAGYQCGLAMAQDAVNLL